MVKNGFFYLLMRLVPGIIADTQTLWFVTKSSTIRTATYR